MNKQKLITLTMAVIMGVSLTACGSSKDNAGSNGASGEENVKLKMYTQYSSDAEKVPVDYALKALSKEMPNVKITIDIAGQDDNQKLKTYAASGNLPDIFQSNTDVINVFRKSNNILQLDEYLNEYDFSSKLLPSNNNLLYADDQHAYAFPFAGNDINLIFYNKELFEQYDVKVPTTYDELIEAANVFNKNGITPLSIFGKEKWITMALYDVIATRFDTGGILKLDAMQANASDPAYADAAAMMEKLIDAGLLSKSATLMNYDQAAGEFYDGKAAMFLNGAWEIPETTKHMGDKADYMYYPAQDTASYESNKYAFGGSGSLGGFSVNPNSKNKDLAAKVASFLALKVAEGRMILSNNPIVATKVDKEPEQELAPMFKRLNEDLEKITSTTAFSWGLANAKIKVALEDETQKMIAGEKASVFVKNIDKAINQAK